MTYAVTVDTQFPNGAPELDELHRVGAGALLEHGFDSVESIDGPDGVEAEIADTWVGVHPGGALLKVFVDAPALEFAEQAVRALVEELLERSELLADWTVERCEVELHPDIAKESLEAADGPDAPPDDISSRRARLTEPNARDASADATGEVVDTEMAQRRMRSMAAGLRAFGPEMFGAPDEEEKDDELADSGSRLSVDDAELAAGALVWATDVLLDELFQDVYALAEEETNVADCDRPMWLLDELPPRYALRYDARFARRFLVTAIALTTRFTEGSFEQLSCVAEELALRLLLGRAEVALETFGLLDDGVASALECFTTLVCEDMDHEWLYDDAKDGIDESSVGDYLGVVPMGLTSWFTPFNDHRFVHPYVMDEPFAEES
ncbi:MULTISPECIES: hypothetical protein [Streptomyces]|uniref:hypothetical protein n=1 Tax=Streptomyces TaxID=1883 RepID=UPI0006999E2A|nr:hypothetical protein [Streptomyces sp. SID7805]